ncbi:MAG: homogentisate phytyltransferase [Jaaginema sp. PMC 1079.18]|nr:homogentisate phytyltransferase [Jaaginema sp. PMC 1080.18]MEC4850709.1 homogentisate phytyltransferase [Jaaginema sp. PMC 1079.18]MEC4864714.1 homogentisate phytyltransferase [Jaaginema sp. PMC 1078.18]
MTQISPLGSQTPISWLYSLWKFSRPHTIIGTTLSVLALFLLAIAATGYPVNFASSGQLLGAIAACLCGNVYIVGLNQLEDIAIDAINKPHLPLAAGEFSPQQGRWIVGITGVLALVLAAVLGFWLGLTVAVSLVIGTAYSLPPIRLKRFPLLAALCIFTVRGVIVNLGLFLHFSQQFGGKIALNAPVGVLTLFVVVFTIAIAIFKDVPDTEGDRQYQITTFTLLLGKTKIFNLASGIITFCYLAMILLGFWQIPGINSPLMIGAHGILLAGLWWRSRGVNLDNKAEIASFYQFIWKLFFLEYLVFPVICLVA